MAQQVTLDGGESLELTELGAMVRLKVRRRLDRTGLYKVWLRGKGGELLLGTMIPEGTQLSLERTLSRDALMQAGCWPVTGGKCVMSFHFTDTEPESFHSSWHWEHRPSRRFSDPILAEAAAAWGSMLVREESWGFQLAVPADPHRPFPLLPLFCMACVLPVDGQPHIVFSFHSSGEPKYPDTPQGA